MPKASSEPKEKKPTVKKERKRKPPKEGQTPKKPRVSKPKEGGGSSKSKTMQTVAEEQRERLLNMVGDELEAVQDNMTIMHKQAMDLQKRLAQFLKHQQVRDAFLALTDPRAIEQTVDAIDRADKGQGARSNGHDWEDKYKTNLTEMCRLVDSALNLHKVVNSKKAAHERKLLDLEKKVNEAIDTLLERLNKGLEWSGRPYTVDEGRSAMLPRTPAESPFQCYDE